MTFQISNVVLTCTHAGADTFTNDDTYSIVNGRYRPVFNLTNGRFNNQGGGFSDFAIGGDAPLRSGDRGLVTQNQFSTSNLSDTFNGFANISLFDRDGGTEGADDFMGFHQYVVDGSRWLQISHRF
jgi:hypothetical protein